MTTGSTKLDIDFALLDKRVVDWLREYVMIDTTDPPGDVSRAADWVEGALRAAGIATIRI